jgi:hypothetical protein
MHGPGRDYDLNQRFNIFPRLRVTPTEPRYHSDAKRFVHFQTFWRIFKPNGIRLITLVQGYEAYVVSFIYYTVSFLFRFSATCMVIVS